MGKSGDSRSSSSPRSGAKHTRAPESPEPLPKRSKLDSTPSETEVYVGNLCWDAGEKDIEEFFGRCGPIQHIKLLTTPEGQSRGSAFVHFDTKEDANKALEMDGEDFMNRKIRVNRAGERPQHRGAAETNTVYVGNLAFSTTEDDVSDFLSECGRVKTVRLARDFDGRMKGFAHVEFEEAEAVTRAIEKNGEELLGRSLKINYAVRKDANRGRGTPRAYRSRYQGSDSHY